MVTDSERLPVMTPDTLARVPNQPKTPQRTVRVPDDVWAAAKAKAEERGDNLSEVIRKALERYARSRRATRKCGDDGG